MTYYVKYVCIVENYYGGYDVGNMKLFFLEILK